MRKQELHPRTAVINKKQKNQSKKAKNDALLWLSTTFPHLFDTTLSIQPLKIGIMKDILLHAEEAAALGISRSKIREAIVLFTRRIDYLACLKAREMRIDLEGNPVTAVTEEEAEKAAIKIKKRVEKSARNARKTVLSKSSSSYEVQSSSAKPTASYATKDSNSRSIERSFVNSSAHPTTSSGKSTIVTIKHKSTRTYDPDAVARLKEKLGLSHKKESSTETSS